MPVAGAGLDLDRALEAMRAYATKTINAIDPDAGLPKREGAVKDLNDPDGVAGTLHLILIAEQALHLVEYLRLERVRQTDPDHVESAIAEATRFPPNPACTSTKGLSRPRLRASSACARSTPSRLHDLFAIPGMEKASGRALHELQEFAEAARAPAPDIGRGLRRPTLSETRAEAKRKAVDAKEGVIEVAQIARKATGQGAKYASERVRRSRTGPPTDSE